MWLPFYREGKRGLEGSSGLCTVTGMEINGTWIWTSDPCFLPVFHMAVLGRGSPHLSDPKLPFHIFFFIVLAASGLGCSMRNPLLQCRGRLSSHSTWAPGQMGSRARSVWAQLHHSTGDLSSPTRNWTSIPSVGRWILNNWITGQVPIFSIASFVFWKWNLWLIYPPLIKINI